MRRFVLAFILLIISFFSVPHFLHAQTQNSQGLAKCDACGFCDPAQSPNYTQPQRYRDCQACLYPGLTDTATLQVDPGTLRPPATAAGKYWTMIGCIDVSGGFTQQGASGNVVQVLLNIVFSMVGGIAFLYILYGSFIILTSRADPEKLNHGRRLVMGAIIGVIFSLLSLFIINFLLNQVFKIPTT